MFLIVHLSLPLDVDWVLDISRIVLDFYTLLTEMVWHRMRSTFRLAIGILRQPVASDPLLSSLGNLFFFTIPDCQELPSPSDMIPQACIISPLFSHILIVLCYQY